MNRPTTKDFAALLWQVADWEARFPGYSTKLQTAIRDAVPAEDQPALLEANRNPYIVTPTAAKLAWLEERVGMEAPV